MPKLPTCAAMLRAGAVLERIPGPKYTAGLRFAELVLRAPWPKPATLRKQRASLPEDFTLALRVPKAALESEQGALRFDPRLEAELDAVLQARAALAASMLVLPTSADLTPGVRSRELLSRYVDRARADARCDLVWAPRGVWEYEEAASVARSLDLILAFDPLEQARPQGPLGYARLIAIGARRSFSPAALERVCDALGPDEQRDFVAIESERSVEQATTLERLARGEPSEPNEIDQADDPDEAS